MTVNCRPASRTSAIQAFWSALTNTLPRHVRRAQARLESEARIYTNTETSLFTGMPCHMPIHMSTDTLVKQQMGTQNPDGDSSQEILMGLLGQHAHTTVVSVSKEEMTTSPA